MQSQAPTTKKTFKSRLFTLLPLLLMGGLADNKSLRPATNVGSNYFTGNAEFHPRYHPIMNYATQNRLARKRRRAK